MADEKPKSPTWMYRLHPKTGEPESKLFDDVRAIPRDPKEGWKDSPVEKPDAEDAAK